MTTGSRDPEIERRALSILDELLELDGAVRSAAVEELCGGDEKVRERVQRLLAASGEGELERLDGLPRISDFAPGDGPEFIPGGVVGNYELVRPIASGGMGWVFEAIQRTPRRRVAVKMLRFGADSAEARRRFELESEVLARLEHPRIAKVFDAGVHTEASVAGTRETPYLVLEYVEGATPIVEYVRREGLGTRAILELFLPVCDAIQHGHRKGIVHRDLKSGNVLVDRNGRVKVIDFGVARILGSSLVPGSGSTRAGQLIGTLETMSPEQYSGDPDDVDTRSDVYSLGGLLFELLTGAPVRDLTGLSLADVARVIGEVEPVPARRIRPDLAPDLEAILGRALERDPARRYQSAEALADDIRRYLNREPVEARHPSRLRRVLLFARRNPVASGAALLVTVTLVAASLVSTRFAIRANRASERKDREIEAANRARRAEAEALDHAEQLRGDLLGFTEAVSGGLLGRLEREGATTAVRRAAAEFTIEQVEGLRERAAGDVPTLASLAMSYLSLGDSLGNPTQPNLGDFEAAEASYRSAAEIAGELRELEPEGSEAAYIEAGLAMRYGDLDRGRGDLEGAEANYREAVETFREALDRSPEDERYLAGLAASQSMYGSILGVRGEDEEAGKLFSAALEITEELVRRDPENEGRRRNANALRSKLATSHLELGHLEEAAQLFQEAVDGAREALAEHPESHLAQRALAETLGPLIQTLVAMGRFEDAAETMEEVEEIVAGLLDSGDRDLRVLALEPYSAQLRAALELAWGTRGADGAGRAHLERARSSVRHCLEVLGELREEKLWSGMLGYLESAARDLESQLNEVDASPAGDGPPR